MQSRSQQQLIGKYSLAIAGSENMASRPSPTVRRRRLGSELRELRKAAGLTPEQVEELSGGDLKPYTTSRIENGQRRVTAIVLNWLLDTYGVEDLERRQAMMTLARQASERGWGYSYKSAIPPRV